MQSLPPQAASVPSGVVQTTVTSLEHRQFPMAGSQISAGSHDPQVESVQARLAALFKPLEMSTL